MKLTQAAWATKYSSLQKYYFFSVVDVMKMTLVGGASQCRLSHRTGSWENEELHQCFTRLHLTHHFHCHTQVLIFETIFASCDV